MRPRTEGSEGAFARKEAAPNKSLMVPERNY